MAGDADDDTTYTYVPATSTRKFVAETTTRGRDHAAKSDFVQTEQAAIVRRGKDTSSSSASSPAREAPAVPRHNVKMSKHAKHTLSDIPPLPPGYEEYADQIFSPPMVTVHICRICLRPRSDRYHREHPIAPGKIPPPASICRRCRVTPPDQEPREAKVIRVTESTPIKIGLSGILPHATISRQHMEEEKRRNAKTAKAFYENFIPVSNSPGRCKKLILYRHVSPEEVLGKPRDLRSSSPSEHDVQLVRRVLKSAGDKSNAEASKDASLPRAASDAEAQAVVQAKKDPSPAVTYTESAIRRIAREEVERYRQAERRILAHPEPYARGRLVPAEARERTREAWPSAHHNKGSKDSVKTKAEVSNNVSQPAVEASNRIFSTAITRPSSPVIDKAAKIDTRWWPKAATSPPVIVDPVRIQSRGQNLYPYKDDAAARHSKSANRSEVSRKSETGESRKARLEAVYEPPPEQAQQQSQSKGRQDTRTEAWSKETIRSAESFRSKDQEPRRRTKSYSHSDRPNMVVEHVSLPSYREPVDQQKDVKETQPRNRSSEQADNVSDWTDREYWEHDNTVRSAGRHTSSTRSRNPQRASPHNSGTGRTDKRSMLATVSEEYTSAKTDRTASGAQQARLNPEKSDVKQDLTRVDETDAEVSWVYRLRTIEPVDGQAEQTYPVAGDSSADRRGSRRNSRDAVVYRTDNVLITHRKPAVDSDFRSSSVRFAPVVHITPTPPNSDDYPQSNDRFVEQRSQRRAQRRLDSYGREPPRTTADEPDQFEVQTAKQRSPSRRDSADEDGAWHSRPQTALQWREKRESTSGVACRWSRP